MWVKFNKTIAGGFGLFIEGITYDLPETVLKKLPKKSWQNTVAPWDRHKDKETVKRNEAIKITAGLKKYEHELRAKAEALNTQADEKARVVSHLQKQSEQVKAVAEKAQKEAQAKKANARQKRKALGLAREHERIFAMLQKAHGELQALLAEYELTKMGAEDAVARAKEAAKEAGLDFAKID